MRLPRLARISCALLAASLLLAGCGENVKVANSAANRTHLELGVLNAIDCATAQIAQDRGYFADEGLDVDIKTVATGPEVLSELQAGTLDVGFVDYVTFFGTVSKGAKMHVAADAYQLAPEVQPILALPNSSIHTPRDLAGKRIGVLVTNNIQTLLINELVKAYGVDPKTLHYVTVPFPAMGAALKHGTADAVSTIEPFTTDSETKYGAQVVADMDSGATQGAPISGYVSTQPWASAHTATMQAFRRAMERAAVDAAQRAVVQNVLTHHLKIDPQTAAIVHIGVFPTSVSADRLKRIVDLMSEADMLTHPIDLKAMTS
jgi:NitT/TauT family transport system substrate-binding protein